MRATRLVALGAFWALYGFAAAPAAAITTNVGQQIYREGLVGGIPLEGARAGTTTVVGGAAACIACHRRSGLGTAEGTSRVPPITSKYLFAPPGMSPDEVIASPGSIPGHVRPTPYTDATLVRAIRSGVGRDGRALNYLMPRYALDDANLAALIGYLKTLPTGSAPGVTDTTLHFATIVTPDAAPAARAGMLSVLQQFAIDKNSFIRGGRRPLKAGGQIDFRVTREWDIHLWELRGPATSWRAQLDGYLKAQPVFAVLSGVGGADWAPVHAFCEHESLPCLFPNVEAPPVAEQDFYSLYLSKGVLLEADLMNARLRGIGGGTRVVQLFRSGDSGEVGARALRAAAPAALTMIDERLADAGPVLDDVRAGDTLVLWLRPADLKRLPALPGGVTVWVSGLLAALDAAALPPAWRPAAHLTYPVDLPAQRRLRVSYPLKWFEVRHIPVVAEHVQADTYLACGVVSEALADVTGNFQRDYLIERIEVMLSHRQLSGYYPRLGLAVGQRFASKGGYWAVADPAADASAGNAVVAEGEWTVP